MPAGSEYKSASHLHAEVLAEKMFTDMMASAGVQVNRMAVEVMFFMPKQFRDVYSRLFRRALKGDDSGVDESGRRNDSVGVLGKSAGKNTATGKQLPDAEGFRETRRTEFASGQTAAISGRGKKYKRYWTVEDERALELKDLVDKRLRRLSREIEIQLEQWEEEDYATGRVRRPVVKESVEARGERNGGRIPDAEVFRKGQEELNNKER